MFGIFSNPKCPRCGRELEATGHSFPYPQWRCRPCIAASAEKKKQEDRFERLEQQFKEMEQRLKEAESDT